MAPYSGTPLNPGIPEAELKQGDWRDFEAGLSYDVRTILSLKNEHTKARNLGWRSERKRAQGFHRSRPRLAHSHCTSACLPHLPLLTVAASVSVPPDPVEGQGAVFDKGSQL